MLKTMRDSVASFLAAIVTLAVCIVPAWCAHLAIAAELAPSWAYISVVGLVLCAGAVAFDFLRKAGQGISPGRTRRRR